MRRKGRGGFTLVEILIAIFVLLVGVLGILALFPVGIKASGTAMENTLSSEAARNALSFLERMDIAPRVRMLTGGDATKFPFVFPGDFKTKNHILTDAAERKRLNWEDPKTPPARIVSEVNGQYSWDARFYLSKTLFNKLDTDPNAHRVFPEMYEVMVTVYRNYKEWPLGNVSIQVDTTTNRMTEVLTYDGAPEEKPKPGFWVRPFGRGEWYEVQRAQTTGVKSIKADRPFVEATPSGSGTVITRSVVGRFSVLLSNEGAKPSTLATAGDLQ